MEIINQKEYKYMDDIGISKISYRYKTVKFFFKYLNCSDDQVLNIRKILKKDKISLKKVNLWLIKNAMFSLL